MVVPQRVVDRIWPRIDVRGADECWPWLLSTTSDGYGQVGWWSDGRNHMTTSHRVAWLASGRDLPDGMTIDHVCRTRNCNNPAHMRLLTASDNSRNNAQSLRTHCPHGHAYSGANVLLNGRGHRLCLACREIRKAATD